MDTKVAFFSTQKYDHDYFDKEALAEIAETVSSILAMANNEPLAFRVETAVA